MGLNNIKQVDGLRAIAIILVIIWHYFSLIVDGNLLGQKMFYLKYLTFWTWSGVDLFFIISGFLIGRILLFYKGSKKYFSTFYIRRVFRIFPAYYLIIFAFLLLTWFNLVEAFPWLTDNPFPIFAYIFYIQNFWAAHVDDFGAHWLSVTWSLAVEEQFYLVLPLFILLIERKYLPYILVFFIGAAPGIRAIDQSLGSYVLLPARMDSLLMGVLIAYYHLSGELEKKLANKKMFLTILFFCFFIILFIIGRFETFGGIIIHTVLMLFYSTLLILALLSNKNTLFIKVLSSAPLALIALTSYMVYLTHQIFNGMLHQLILNHEPEILNINDALVTILALIATLTFSGLSYYLYEKPLLKLGKKFNY